MPISLFLTGVTDFRLRLLEVAGSWTRLLSLEETLLRRAAGAFMVRWFGPAIPLASSAVLIAIEPQSFSLLRRKLESVVSQMAYGPSLLEPLAGMVGSIVGPIAGNLAVILFGLFASSGIIAAVIAGIGGVAMIAAPAALTQFGNQDVFAEIQRLMTAAAGLIPELERFWKLSSGPRSEVKNPVLRALLDVCDSLAPLLAHAVGAISVGLQEIVPFLTQFFMTLPAFVNLVKAGLSTLSVIWNDLIDRLTAFLDTDQGPLHPFLLALNALERFPDRLILEFKLLKVILTISKLLVTLFVGIAVDAWISATTAAIQSAIDKHPTVIRWNQTVHKLYDLIKDWVGSKSPPSKPGAFSKAAGWLYGKGEKYLGFPTVPSTAGVPGLDDLKSAAGGEPIVSFGMAGQIAQDLAEMRKQGILPNLKDMFGKGISSVPTASGALPTPFDLNPTMRSRIDDALRPRSVFSAERAKLRAEYGRTPEQELARRREEELAARDKLWSIIDRMLPPAAAGFFMRIEPILETREKQLYGLIYPGMTEKQIAKKLPPPGIRYPVLDLRDDDRLLLEVKSARIVCRDGDKATRAKLNALTGKLRAAWYGNEYLAIPSGANP